MADPVDAIRAFHNAFRNDMKRIDSATLDFTRERKVSVLPPNDFGSLTKYWSGIPGEKS